MSEPTTLQQGDSLSWTLDLPEYPATAGWVLHYRWLPRTGTAVNFDATASGAGFAVARSAAESAAMAVGPGSLLRWVTLGAARVTLGTVPCTVLADLTTAANLDTRSPSERALADANAALAAYLAGGRGHVEEYEIDGTRMRFRSVDDLRKLVQHYEQQVARERAAANLASGAVPGRVMTRF